MRVAVAFENGRILPFFGNVRAFKLYDVENRQVQKAAVVNRGDKDAEPVGFLRGHGVTAVICSSIDGISQAALSEADISLYGGVSGDADDAVRALADGYLRRGAGVPLRYPEPCSVPHPCEESAPAFHPCAGCSSHD